MNLKLVRGRDFTDADAATAPRVAIVNEAFARAAWGSPEALGRTIEANDAPGGAWQRLTIVGVTTDAQLIALGAPVEPYLYVPFAQRYTPRVSLVVKTAGPSAIAQMRTLIREMNPNLAISQAMPLTELTAIGLIPQRIAGAVAGSLGVVGLLLAAIGIDGVTSYNAARRVREIGIRAALGADRGSVLRLMLRQGVLLTLIGLAIGLAAGALVSWVLRSLLVGVAAADPVTFAGGAALILAVALAASYLPARRATRVDPMVALRAE